MLQILRLRYINGKELPLENIDESITLKELKEKISEKSSPLIPPEYIMLIHKGNQLGNVDINNKSNNMTLIEATKQPLKNLDGTIRIRVDVNKYKSAKLLRAQQKLAFMKGTLDDDNLTNDLPEFISMAKQILGSKRSKKNTKKRKKNTKKRKTKKSKRNTKMKSK